jgi:hypothetical protein
MAVVATAFDVVAELGGDGDLVADRCERLSDELLAPVWSVNLGGVEERDASFMGGASSSVRSGLRRPSTRT